MSWYWNKLNGSHRKGEALVRFETFSRSVLLFVVLIGLVVSALYSAVATSFATSCDVTSCRSPACRPATNLMRTRPRLACTWPRPCLPTLLTQQWSNLRMIFQQWSSMSFPFFSQIVFHACASCVFLFVPALSAFFFSQNGPFVHLGSVTIRSLPAGCSSTWPSSSFKCKLKRTKGEDMWRSPSPGQLHKLHQIVIKYLYHPLPVPDSLKIMGFARSYII